MLTAVLQLKLIWKVCLIDINGCIGLPKFFEEVFWLCIKQLDCEFRVFKQIDARESFSTNQNQN